MSTEERIIELVEDIRKDIGDMKVTIAKQEENLKEHMRRSLANEEAIDIIKDELKSVNNHVIIVQAVTKIVAILATSSTALYIIRRLIG